VDNTLYVVGGYGPDLQTGDFNTKSTLTAIDVPKLIHWVEGSSKKLSAKQCIRQIEDPIFQVTGGQLHQTSSHDPFLLIFGQNFNGFYTDGSNGIYTQQVRTFNLIDDGRTLAVFGQHYGSQNPNYRRRDLNVVPIMHIKDKHYEQSFLALSGVFTLNSGIWTVPVAIDSTGSSFMPDPSKSSTLKQGMNNYSSAHMGLFSEKANVMHTVLLGGIGYETFADDTFTFDSEIPFTNNCVDIRISKHGNMTQHLLPTSFPTILSTKVNPGNLLLFGATARFIKTQGVSAYSNGVIALDKIKKKTLVGYVVGGIQSTLPNTNDQADSSASTYIFEVFVSPK
jgi:hypothetical protein